MNKEGSPRRGGIFDQLRKSPITRQDSQWLGGVATGVAGYFKVDVVLIRGIFVVLGVLGGLGLVLYGFAWALLPDSTGRIHLEQAIGGKWSSGMTGAVIMVVLAMFPAPWFLDSVAPILWPIAIIGAILFIIFSRKKTKFERPPRADSASSTALERPWRNDPADEQGQPRSGGNSFTASASAGTWTDSTAAYPPEDPMSSSDTGPAGQYENNYSPDPQYTKPYSSSPAKKQPPAKATPAWVSTIVFGLAILAVAVVLLADYLEIVDLPGAGWPVALAAGLLVSGVAIVLAALSHRTSGGMLGYAIPLLVLTILFSASSLGSSDRNAIRSGDGQNEYTAVFSSSTLDLTHLGTITAPTTVELDAAFSKVEIVLPDNVPVQVKSDGIFMSDRDLDLPQAARDLPGNAPTLTLDIDGVFSSFNTAVASTGSPVERKDNSTPNDDRDF